MKVIFFAVFPAYEHKIPLYEPGTDPFYSFGMGQFIAQEFKFRNYPVTFENWRMDLRIQSRMEKEIDGMLCRIFPSKRIKLFGKSFGEHSSDMIEAFRKELCNPDTVFHFMPNQVLSFHWLARMAKKHNIVATHLGGANPYWKFVHQKKWKSGLRYLLDKHFFLKPYKHLITIVRPELDYYQMLNIPATHMPVFGLAREHLFTIKSRNESRKRLGLPNDKKILLQLGRASSVRGFDWIMDLIDHYQQKEDYFLVFAGINEVDQYYDQLKAKGVYMTPYLSHPETVDYYNAADLLYYLPNGLEDLNFAGTSYVPLEALACGTPVVATTLHHFPGEEVHEVSRIPKCKADVIPMIEDLLHANVSRERCREIVLKHFSWDVVLEKHWDIYNGKH